MGYKIHCILCMLMFFYKFKNDKFISEIVQILDWMMTDGQKIGANCTQKIFLNTDIFSCLRCQ